MHHRVCERSRYLHLGAAGDISAVPMATLHSTVYSALSPPPPAASPLCSLNSIGFAVSGKSQERSSCSSYRTAVEERAHESREEYSFLLAL